MVYMKVVPELSIMTDLMKAFLDDPEWLKHIRTLNWSNPRGKLL